MQFDPSVLFRLGFFIALFFFTLHAIILSYHWVSFGAKRSQSALAMGIYLCGGALLLLTLAGSLSFL